MKNLFKIFWFILACPISMQCMEDKSAAGRRLGTDDLIDIDQCNMFSGISLDNIDAQVALAQQYIERENFKEAKNWLEIGCKKNDPGALFWLGRIYHITGNSNQAIKSGNLNRAIKLYERAVFFMDNKIHHDLLLKAEHFLGVAYDDRGEKLHALYHFRIAAQGQFTIAQLNAGILYEEMGKLAMAKKYYTMASDKGNVRASYKLGMLLYEKSKRKEKKAMEQKNEALRSKADAILKKADNLFRLASKEGNGSASYNLAAIFEIKGKRKIAIKYYLKAHRQGCPKAEKALKSLQVNF